MKRIAWMMLAISVFVLPARAQTKSQDEMKARITSHRSDFDYLLGDWEFTAEDQTYGKYHGVWSAAKFGDRGQVFDEYRVTGDKGETYVLVRTIRVYNAPLDQWELVSVDGGAGLQNIGTAKKVGDEMHLEQKGGYGTDHPNILRIRYYNIRPDAFSWVADRSTDDGKTWTANYMKIEAKRTGPARSLAPLTVAKPVAASSR